MSHLFLNMWHMLVYTIHDFYNENDYHETTSLQTWQIHRRLYGVAPPPPLTLNKTNMSNVIKQEKPEEKEKRKKRVTYMIAPMRKGPYGISFKTEKKRHKNVTLFMQIDSV